MELRDGITTLRPPVEADAPAMAAMVRSTHELLAPWMPWSAPDYGTERALEWIRGIHDETEQRFLIVDGDDFVGACGLNRVDPLHRTANLGYWLSLGATGRGHATRATRLIAAHGLASDDIECVYIQMSVHNEESRRVAERAGGVYEGVLRSRLLLHGARHDIHSFSLTAADLGAD